MSMDLFITASGTEIGKTFVAEHLIGECMQRGISCDALKPIISGFDESPESDTARLLAALQLPATTETIAACSPWRFAEPLSPNMAAAREGRRIALHEVVEFCRRPSDVRLRLIEGVGGVMVPLNEQETTLDWIALLGTPVIVVCGSYLGSISHALTAKQALQSRDVQIQALIVSQSLSEPVPLEETRATIQQFAQDTPVVSISRYGEVCANAGPQGSLLEATGLVPAGA